MTDPVPEGVDARLAKASAVVGVGTALSRVTGLLRVGALTYALGAGALADAYNLANNTPNIVYELILGGVLSATLVPVFVDHFERDDEDGVSAVVSVAVAAMVALTVVAVLAAPLIMKAYTVRLSDAEADAQAAVAVPLLRLFLPQMLFYGLTALGTALLNARRRFAAPAYAPILNNLVVSAALLALPHVADGRPSLDEVRHDATLLWLLGAGTTLGIVAMTVALLPALRRSGWNLRWHPDWRHPSVRQVARLSGWTFGYVAANQVALLVVLALANGHDRGAVSAYTYAFVFFQLPHGLFAVSIMTTFVPELAVAASRGDFAVYRERFSLGVRFMTLVVLPAAIGYVLLARPLVSVLLERGAFDAGDTRLTADVLANFAIGLLGFSLYLFALRGYYALKDTRTPFFLNVVQNSLNVVLAIALVGRYGVQGLAFAYSVSYSVAAVVALAALRSRVGGLDGERLARGMARTAVAAGIMALAVWALTRTVGDDHGSGAAIRLAVTVPIGAAVYGVAAILVKVDALDGLRERLSRR